MTESFRQRVRGATVRVAEDLNAAGRRHGADRVDGVSADGSVRVRMSGESKVDTVEFHPRHFESLDSRSLTANVIEAYTLAREAVHRHRLTNAATALSTVHDRHIDETPATATEGADDGNPRR